MTYSTDDLLTAVNKLILEKDPRVMVDALNRAVDLAKLIPISLKGDMEFLNPLLAVAVEDRPKYAALQGLIDSRREEAQMDLLWPEVKDQGFDKVAYQRQLMQARRVRAGRAVAIENMQRPDHEKIVGTDRLEFERRVLKKWGDRIRDALQTAREIKGGALTRDQEEAVRTREWDAVDAELDEREAAVRLEALKPAHLRKKV